MNEVYPEAAEISVSYIGSVNLSVPDEVVLVEADCQYVRFCQALSEDRSDGAAREVWVREETHFAWLKDFLEQVGVPGSFTRKTARDILADKWKAAIPDWLDDETVIAQNLLDLPIHDQKDDGFVNKILAHFFGEGFRSSKLEGSNLGRVLHALVQEQAQMHLEHYPVLTRCLQEKAEDWAYNSQNEWARHMSRLLGNDPRTAWKYMSFWELLANYPRQLLEYVLPANDSGWVRGLPLNVLGDIGLEPSAKEQAVTQIEFFFGQVEPEVKTSEHFKKIVESVSGWLPKELTLVKAMIRSKNVADLENVQTIQERFQRCPGVSSAELRALRYLIKPKKPEIPENLERWTADNWIHWTLDEYLPFRSWQEHALVYDKDVENVTGQFSDWYTNEYIEVHQNRELSLVSALEQVRDASSSALTVVLLVDCLGIQFVSVLDEAFHNFGLNRHQLNYRFAPLPTTTRTNKPLLLSGQWEANGSSYEQILSERKNADWKGRPVLYVSSLQGLSDLEVSHGGAIVVLNFVDSDKLLHENVEAQKTSHEEELQRLFHRMAQTCFALTERWAGEKTDIEVLVCSDHGACKILDEEKKSFDSQAVNKLFPDEQHRFCSVDKAKASQVPENVWELGYKFEDPFADSPQVHFIPRGHNTVRAPAKGKAYLHGGATPEEVIVPQMVYKPVKVAWKPLATRFLNLDFSKDTARPRFYVQRVVPVEIEAQNPNSSAAVIKRVSVISPETDLKRTTTPLIQPGKAEVVQLDCYFQKSAVDASQLEVEITYELAGEEHTLQESVACDFRSAMKAGLNLKDLF